MPWRPAARNPKNRCRRSIVAIGLSKRPAGPWEGSSEMLNRVALALLLTLLAGRAGAQTPSPLAYWQYSVGELLSASEDKGGSDWDVTLGGGAIGVPKFEGGKHYQGEPSLILDIRYGDIAFLSDGEGAGVNLIRGKNYRAGVALGYDLGRDQHDDARLKGL